MTAMHDAIADVEFLLSAPETGVAACMTALPLAMTTSATCG